MKNTIKRNDFINILVDCNGYSEDDAKELADEYQNNYNEYFEDLGTLQDALNFIN